MNAMADIMTLNPAFAFAGGLAVALIVLLVLEIYNSKRIGKISSPIYEFALKKAETEATRIVDEARQEARRLIEQAESASIALTGMRKGDIEKAEKNYETSLRTELEKMEGSIKKSEHIGEEVQKRIEGVLAGELEEGGKGARAKLEQALASLEATYAQQLKEQVAAIAADAKKHADEYERVRKQAVDERVLALVSDTVKIVLGQSLPPEVHASLARAALEEAKARGVF